MQQMDLPTPKNYNVIDTEIRFGISRFICYHSYFVIPRGILFYARFRKYPENMHLVVCPLRINARNLRQEDQENLQLYLDVSLMAKTPQVGISRHGVKEWESNEERQTGEEAIYIDHASPRCQAAERFPRLGALYRIQ